MQTLEEARDTAELPEASGEAIAREFERYLRRRDIGPGQTPGGHATESGDTSYLRDTSGGRARPPKPVRPETGSGTPPAGGPDGRPTADREDDGGTGDGRDGEGPEDSSEDSPES